MSQWDRDHPPTGEGYIFTLQGRHYHHDEEDPQQQELFYVVNSFLKSDTGLQQWTIKTEDGRDQDVGRLGISHARAQQIDWVEIPYDPKGPDSLIAKLDDRRAELYYTPSLYGTAVRGNQFGGIGGRRGRATPGFGGAALGAAMAGGIPADIMGEFGSSLGGMRGGFGGRGMGASSFGMGANSFQNRSSLPSRSLAGGGAFGRAGQGTGNYGRQAYGAIDPRTGLPSGELPEGMELIYETQFFVEFVWKRTEKEDRFATREEAAEAVPAPAEDEAGTGMDDMGMGLEDYYGN
jgi:hypothetical protein